MKDECWAADLRDDIGYIGFPERLQELDAVVRRAHVAKQVVVGLQLLRARVRHMKRGEELPVRRRVVRPAELDDLKPRLRLEHAVGRRAACQPPPGMSLLQNETRHTLGMPDRYRHGDPGPGARHAEE